MYITEVQWYKKGVTSEVVERRMNGGYTWKEIQTIVIN